MSGLEPAAKSQRTEPRWVQRQKNVKGNYRRVCTEMSITLRIEYGRKICPISLCWKSTCTNCTSCPSAFSFLRYLLWLSFIDFLLWLCSRCISLLFLIPLKASWRSLVSQHCHYRHTEALLESMRSVKLDHTPPHSHNPPHRLPFSWWWDHRLTVQAIINLQHTSLTFINTFWGMKFQ